MNALRTDFELSRKIIVATAILFNFGRMMNDEDDDELEAAEVDEEEDLIVFDADQGTQRLRGQVERDRLCDAMQ